MFEYYISVFVDEQCKETVLLNACKGYAEGKVTFGRAENNDIVLPYPAVSRSHGYIVFSGDKVYMQDNGSANKLNYNDRQLTKIPLKNKMLIALSPDEDADDTVRLYFTVIKKKDALDYSESPEKATTESANMGKRFVAFMVDFFIIMLMMIGAFVLVLYLHLPGKVAITGISFFAISILYFSLSEFSRKRATPGKLFSGITVGDLKGFAPTFKMTFTRAVFKLIFAPFFFFAYLPVYGRDQTLYDLISKTKVYKR